MLQTRDRFSMSIRRPLTWNPNTITQPILDPDLERMPVLRRTAVILHYRLAALEYALSPNGTLRAFVRLCTMLGLMLSISALLILPPLVLLFYGLADVAAAIAQACLSILKAMLYVIGIVAIGMLLMAVFNRKRNQ
jgi:hypothetical protein